MKLKINTTDRFIIKLSEKIRADAPKIALKAVVPNFGCTLELLDG
jgi:hypothetical protein